MLRGLEVELKKNAHPGDLDRAKTVASWLKERGADISLSPVATPIEKTAIKTFSRDQLIIPETVLPRYVSEILQRVEKAGITSLEPYHLSGIALTKDAKVDGWNKKPENWLWEQIANGKIAKDSAKLPDAWVLIDKTQKPDYENGRQMYQNDPFGPLLAKLRKEDKIKVPKELKHIPETSRFGISPDELRDHVLPEIAKLLGVEVSAGRRPKEIEFSLIGNFKHPEWGETNTAEWLDDKFGDGNRLIGGSSDNGGLADVYYGWSGGRSDRVGFRPLVVLSPKA